MKSKLLLLTMLFLGVCVSAQQVINYKALIKDDLGNALVNQSVTVQFTILQGAAQTNVYQETHYPITDANGIIIVNIGKGATSDDFSIIAWSSDDHFLNVQIDTGSGLTNMGTTQFMAVPYALSAANVTGLETVWESNGPGLRWTRESADTHGNVGFRAVDLSISIPQVIFMVLQDKNLLQ